MAWWQPDVFIKKMPFLVKRAQIVSSIRKFFDTKGFHAVETPILQVSPVMDTHIHGFETLLKNTDLSARKKLYLHTSPEFDMKKLMVAGLEEIYQICHVFRNAEGSKIHSPEFTMLEWYRAHVDYTAIMTDCIDLLRTLAHQQRLDFYSHKNSACDPFKDWLIVSVCEAFQRYANIDLEKYLDDVHGFSAEITKQGIRVASDDRWDDLFFRVMAEKIEPNLGHDCPAILYDYPASMASLSRRKASDLRFAERFELYICGLELANAFSELTDATEQRQRFEEEMAVKQILYGETYPPDEEFFRALEYGLPASAGIALGVDRLVMLATSADDISQVLWSPVQL